MQMSKAKRSKLDVKTENCVSVLLKMNLIINYMILLRRKLSKVEMLCLLMGQGRFRLRVVMNLSLSSSSSYNSANKLERKFRTTTNSKWILP